MTRERNQSLVADDQFAPLKGARIGFLIDRWNPTRGGAEAALQALANRLAELGAQLLIFSAQADQRQLPEHAKWHRVPQTGIFRGQREANFARDLIEAARGADCDVTIGTRHLPKVDFYWPHGGCYDIALKARRLSRGQQRGRTPRGRHKVFMELEGALFERAGAMRVVCVSRMVEQELKHAYPSSAERLVTIHNGVDLDRFHPRERFGSEGRGNLLRSKLELDESTPLILFSAREPLLKGLPNLLQALASDDDSRAQLLVAGVRRAARWQRMVRELGLQERTHFIEEGDPVALSSAADLCVLPTWRDACSLVVLECLASGTPVITTNRNGASGVINTRTAGTVLDDPSDVAAIRRAIQSHLRAPDASAVDRRDQVRETVLELNHVDWLDALAIEVAQLVRPNA